MALDWDEVFADLPEEDNLTDAEKILEEWTEIDDVYIATEFARIRRDRNIDPAMIYKRMRLKAQLDPMLVLQLKILSIFHKTTIQQLIERVLSEWVQTHPKSYELFHNDTNWLEYGKWHPHKRTCEACGRVEQPGYKPFDDRMADEAMANCKKYYEKNPFVGFVDGYGGRLSRYYKSTYIDGDDNKQIESSTNT